MGDGPICAQGEMPCGTLVIGAGGQVQAANDRLCSWLGMSYDALAAMPGTHVFSLASRVIYETSIVPLLRLKGEVEGAILDLQAQDGSRVPVLLSLELGQEGGQEVTRIVMLRASARRNFEHDLIVARAKAEAQLGTEQREGELREQFVAVLGHDLRNPVASMSAAIRMLSKEPHSPRGEEVLRLMQGSVQRMTRLIDNLLDFARNRLGGGIDLSLTEEALLEPQIRQVVEELRAVDPERVIELDLSLDHPLRCDSWRLGQMLSNLLGNALTHGDPGQPVRVVARTHAEGALELSVSNHGRPIPDADRARLFDPFVRSLSQGNRKGLGLGLYIALEIAKAHGGTLDVHSDAVETRFTFRMPCRETAPA